MNPVRSKSSSDCSKTLMRNRKNSVHVRSEREREREREIEKKTVRELIRLDMYLSCPSTFNP